MIPARYVEITADALLITGSGRVSSIVLTPAAAVSSLILYNNTAASGDKLITLQAAANGGSVSVTFAEPVAFDKGLYADIGGTSATAYVYLV